MKRLSPPINLPEIYSKHVGVKRFVATIPIWHDVEDHTCDMVGVLNNMRARDVSYKWVKDYYGDTNHVVKFNKKQRIIKIEDETH